MKRVGGGGGGWGGVKTGGGKSVEIRARNPSGYPTNLSNGTDLSNY